MLTFLLLFFVVVVFVVVVEVDVGIVYDNVVD